jgi:hypothetical protein
MDLKGKGWGMDLFVHLTQDRGYWWALVNTVMKLHIL